MVKLPSFEACRGLLTKYAYMHFSRLYSFQPFVGHFLLLLEIGTTLIKFYFCRLNFLVCFCAADRALRFNKAKIILGNAFCFALGGKKESKYVERTLFWSSSGNIDFSLNTQPQNKHICFFPHYFRLAPFFPLPVATISWD